MAINKGIKYVSRAIEILQRNQAVMAFIFNPSTQKAEAGGFELKASLVYISKSQANHGFIVRSCHKNPTNNNYSKTMERKNSLRS